MTEYTDVGYRVEGGVATVTIRRPQVYNAYALRTLQEMRDAFRAAAFDDAVAVIVLTGEGDKAFCTGGDVKEYADVYTKRPRDYWKYMVEFQDAVDALRDCGKPTIARVNGVCAGGGNEFHIACDLSVAADDVDFLQVGTRVGSVAAGGATQWLPLLIGDRRAREMLYLCERVPAAKALEWGLVNWVVPRSELDAKVREVADKLIDKFPECLRYTKQQVNFWKDFAWHQTIGHARDWLTLHFATREPYEGMRAFVEKRKPDYRPDGSPEFLHGAPTYECPSCGAKGLPEGHSFCGKCGTPLRP
jgi:enoyl-CoA hydratase/carnithine racemase